MAGVAAAHSMDRATWNLGAREGCMGSARPYATKAWLQQASAWGDRPCTWQAS